jgi:hypothetical protein
MRKIPRNIYEAARDVARSLFGTEAYTQSRRDRKKVEMQFAQCDELEWVSTEPAAAHFGARDTFHLAAIVQNLKTMALRLLPSPPELARA